MFVGFVQVSSFYTYMAADISKYMKLLNKYGVCPSKMSLAFAAPVAR